MSTFFAKYVELFSRICYITIKGSEKMLTLYNNIKKRREELGMTKVRLAELVGYDRSMITKIEQGKVDLTQSKIAALAKALQTTTIKLMGENNENDLPENISTIPQTKKVPLLGSIACGTPTFAVENVENYVDMDSDIHADFALRCKGDSMINARIMDGDIVYIRKQEHVENGEIAAVLINDCTESEATLKRVYISSDKIRLCAENPAYKDIVFFEEDINKIRILGKAVAFLSGIET